MAFELIELGRDVQYIDILPDRVPYNFSIKLIDRTFVFTIKYNEIGKFYTLDLRTPNGDYLVFGEPIIYGQALFSTIEDERFPLPVIIPYCLTGEDYDTVTVENLGGAVRLYLHDRRVAK